MAVVEVLEGHELAEILVGGLGVGRLREVALFNHLGLHRIAVRAADDVGVDDERGLEVGGLIGAGRVAVAHLDHALAAVGAGFVAIHSEREAEALDIDRLAGEVVVVEGRAAHLDLHSAGLVLDVETLVEVARLVGGGHLAGYDDVLVDGPRNRGLVHRCQLAYGVRRGQGLGGQRRRIVVLQGIYGFEFLAGNGHERQCGKDEDEMLFHGARI